MTPDATLCPPNLRESIDRYVDEGIETGGFLRAVLENNLWLAVVAADEINQALIPAVVAYVIEAVPAGIIGSPERVARHLKAKRMEARAKVVAETPPPEPAR